MVSTRSFRSPTVSISMAHVLALIAASWVIPTGSASLSPAISMGIPPPPALPNATTVYGLVSFRRMSKLSAQDQSIYADFLIQLAWVDSTVDTSQPFSRTRNFFPTITMPTLLRDDSYNAAEWTVLYGYPPFESSPPGAPGPDAKWITATTSVAGVFSNRMKVYDFPMDIQRVGVQLEMDYWSITDARFELWPSARDFVRDDGFLVSEWRVMGGGVVVGAHHYRQFNRTVSSLTATVTLERQYEYYMTRAVSNIILLVLLTLMAASMRPMTPDRFMVGVSTFMATISWVFVLSEDSPRSGELTRLDSFVNVSFATIFFLALFSAVNYLWKEFTKKEMDGLARLGRVEAVVAGTGGRGSGSGGAALAAGQGSGSAAAGTPGSCSAGGGGSRVPFGLSLQSTKFAIAGPASGLDGGAVAAALARRTGGPPLTFTPDAPAAGGKRLTLRGAVHTVAMARRTSLQPPAPAHAHAQSSFAAIATIAAASGSGGGRHSFAAAPHRSLLAGGPGPGTAAPSNVAAASASDSLSQSSSVAVNPMAVLPSPRLHDASTALLHSPDRDGGASRRSFAAMGIQRPGRGKGRPTTDASADTVSNRGVSGQGGPPLLLDVTLDEAPSIANSDGSTSTASATRTALLGLEDADAAHGEGTATAEAAAAAAAAAAAGMLDPALAAALVAEAEAEEAAAERESDADADGDADAHSQASSFGDSVDGDDAREVERELAARAKAERRALRLHTQRLRAEAKAQAQAAAAGAMAQLLLPPVREGEGLEAAEAEGQGEGEGDVDSVAPAASEAAADVHSAGTASDAAAAPAGGGGDPSGHVELTLLTSSSSTSGTTTAAAAAAASGSSTSGAVRRPPGTAVAVENPASTRQLRTLLASGNAPASASASASSAPVSGATGSGSADSSSAKTSVATNPLNAARNAAAAAASAPASSGSAPGGSGSGGGAGSGGASTAANAAPPRRATWRVPAGARLSCLARCIDGIMWLVDLLAFALWLVFACGWCCVGHWDRGRGPPPCCPPCRRRPRFRGGAGGLLSSTASGRGNIGDGDGDEDDDAAATAASASAAAGSEDASACGDDGTPQYDEDGAPITPAVTPAGKTATARSAIAAAAASGSPTAATAATAGSRGGSGSGSGPALRARGGRVSMVGNAPSLAAAAAGAGGSKRSCVGRFLISALTQPVECCCGVRLHLLHEFKPRQLDKRVTAMVIALYSVAVGLIFLRPVRVSIDDE